MVERCSDDSERDVPDQQDDLFNVTNNSQDESESDDEV